MCGRFVQKAPIAEIEGSIHAVMRRDPGQRKSLKSTPSVALERTSLTGEKHYARSDL
jgi:hypothetical protein